MSGEPAREAKADPRLSAILEALGRSVRSPSIPSNADELEAWLEARALDPRDQKAFSALGKDRLFVYRRLIQRGLAGAISEEIPRTKERLGERFPAEVSRFFDEEMPRSHYLRDVAFEFVDWASKRWAGDPDLPPYLSDLARHELSAFEVAAARGESSQEVSPELALDRAVVLHASARLRRYGFPIHRLADGDTELGSAPTALLVYRDPEHEVRYLELSPLAAAILERLLAGEALGAAITGACAALGAGFGVEDSALFFADLADRGVLLGAK